MSEYLDERLPLPDDEHLVETINVLQSIPGGTDVLDWFRGTPSFHDAEILHLDLNRRGASLRVSVPGRMTDDSMQSGAVITFVFKKGDMIDVSLEGFSRQNVMGDMWLRFANGSPVDSSLVGVDLGQGDVKFEIEPCYGAFGTICATVEKIAITAVDDYQKADAPSSMTE